MTRDDFGTLCALGLLLVVLLSLLGGSAQWD